ncbi:D-alanyl-D-alanine carboxypeptidase [Synechococcus sp. PCC 7502]|uniref:M15 family metallopeptidase n=1 Tax=Synechococcus sp. PCC 7502 TaxID=1173263 RepID=UPI00029FDD72|nr:M15 family metallopeptidase [Synechococcus sp. PCC 7502]AFY73672.1 D-alanyl-D-alanine carboxypeptidase [Synechococcus sp. PCC 7502]
MPSPKDVPIARRVNHISPPPKRVKNKWGRIIFLIFLVIFVAIAAVVISTIVLNIKSPQSEPIPIVEVTPIPNAVPTPTDNKLLGHFAYTEAPLDSLEVVAIAPDGHEIKLRHAAAEKYRQMVSDAKASGIELMAISGFRSIEDQRQLFFEISRERNQTPAQRAKVSAPPGHSEHHTGYAIDIGDRNTPSTILNPAFNRTDAFRWLQKNASKYSFELSFPENNSQGVMYEPWHWRFVGDDQSLSTFYKHTN